MEKIWQGHKKSQIPFFCQLFVNGNQNIFSYNTTISKPSLLILFPKTVWCGTSSKIESQVEELGS